MPKNKPKRDSAGAYDLTLYEAISQRIAADKLDQPYTDRIRGYGVLLHTRTRMPVFACNGVVGVLFGYTELSHALSDLNPDLLFERKGGGALSPAHVLDFFRRINALTVLDGMDVTPRTKANFIDNGVPLICMMGQHFDMSLIHAGLRTLGTTQGVLMVAERANGLSSATDGPAGMAQVVAEGRGIVILGERRYGEEESDAA